MYHTEAQPPNVLSPQTDLEQLQELLRQQMKH